MGTGYGAAVQWGYMQGCGIRGLHVGQLYMMDGCGAPDIGTGYGAAVQLGYMQGGGVGGLHVGQRYRMAG